MSDAEGVSALIVRVGAVSCALPSACLLETMRPLPVQPLDSMPAFTTGVATIRGAATPVVDLAAVLGEAPDEVSGAKRFVTIRAGARTVALAVDEVVGLARFEPGTLASRPSILSTASDPVVEALAIKDDALHLVLDAARLVEQPERRP